MNNFAYGRLRGIGRHGGGVDGTQGWEHYVRRGSGRVWEGVGNEYLELARDG